MPIFHGLFASGTTGGIRATERVDRPLRAAARRERATIATPR